MELKREVQYKKDEILAAVTEGNDWKIRCRTIESEQANAMAQMKMKWEQQLNCEATRAKMIADELKLKNEQVVLLVEQMAVLKTEKKDVEDERDRIERELSRKASTHKYLTTANTGFQNLTRKYADQIKNQGILRQQSKLNIFILRFR